MSSSVQEDLLNLTKPTTEAVKITVGALLHHVCSSATTSNNNTFSNQDDANNNSDVTIEASSVSQLLVVNLLGCKSSNAAAPTPSQIQRAHALICVIDKILSFKVIASNNLLESLTQEFLVPFFTSNNNHNNHNKQNSKAAFEPQLVAAAWGVLQRELESEMPPVVAAVVSSIPARQSAAMLLIVKRWLNERLVFNENGREALQNAMTAKPQQNNNNNNNAVSLLLVDGEDGGATATSGKKNENNNNEGEDDDAYSQMLSRQKRKITSAEAMSRIELLKHLCEGLEHIPQGNSDALNLRNSLMEFGFETAEKSGGTKSWGVYGQQRQTQQQQQTRSNNNNNTSGGELRALVAALEGHVELFGASTKNYENAKDDANIAADSQLENNDIISKNSSTTKKLLNEACDTVDDILAKILQQQQNNSHNNNNKKNDTNQNNKNILTSSSVVAPSTIANKKQPFSVPVYTSLLLDSGVIPNSTAATTASSSSFIFGGDGAVKSNNSSLTSTSNLQQQMAMHTHLVSILSKERELQHKIRGPIQEPINIVSPYFVPPNMSDNGRLAHRCWYESSEKWAAARSSVGDLKWVIIEGINDQEFNEDGNNNNHIASQIGDDDDDEYVPTSSSSGGKHRQSGVIFGGGEIGVNINASQAQNFFF